MEWLIAYGAVAVIVALVALFLRQMDDTQRKLAAKERKIKDLERALRNAGTRAERGIDWQD